MVTGVVYRHPGLLVKTITTLDVLSGGRAYLGIGASWFQREAQALGVPFPPLKERFEQLEETLRIAKQMWSPNNGPFVGKHFKLAETLCVPQPLSKPHPPILIGGSGEQKTLRMVAKYGNACNLFLFLGPDVLRQKLDILKRHCDTEKRPYSEIEKTTLGSVKEGMTSKDVIQSCKQAAELGFQQAIFNFENIHTLKPLESFIKDVIPAVSGL
jgi:alkanesulfonate monooxygenase SsuD/methylene tetrahydromethanopterin reductase-like flavin-dependent oxidoreductase (luciferase family)